MDYPSYVQLSVRITTVQLTKTVCHGGLHKDEKKQQTLIGSFTSDVQIVGVVFDMAPRQMFIIRLHRKKLSVLVDLPIHFPLMVELALHDRKQGKFIGMI